MATKLPRLNVVVDPAIYEAVSKLSKSEGLSMSLVARDLIREALVIYEDVYWAKEAEARERTFLHKDALRHEDVWGTRKTA